ncbi:hypothetical protein ABZU32_08945 [Sphaerisporangium sp. NPDC005288]|uniref:RICIN domain-containing protein n=1 Tax=Sphaerisporangium sp. NPDC005288 TaxID=3155114 RepID=UPI0033ABA4F5
MLIAALMLVLLPGVALATPSQAAGLFTFRGHLQQWATGRCLDGNYQVLYTSPCQAGNNWQTWEIKGNYGPRPGHRAGTPDYNVVQIRNMHTKLCIEMFEGTIEITREYTLRMRDCVSDPIHNDTQGLDARGPNYNNVQFVNPFDGPICIDAGSNGKAYALECNYGTYQTWRLTMRQ